MDELKKFQMQEIQEAIFALMELNKKLMKFIIVFSTIIVAISDSLKKEKRP